MNPDRFSRSFQKRFQLAMTILVVASLAVFANVSQAQDKVSFETDIKPLFEKHCIRCHGPEEQENDFRIDDRDELMSSYIESGDASFSDLYQLVSTDDEDDMMPPKGEGGPLSETEIELVRNWINQGAVWPESVSVDLVKAVVEEVKEQVAKEQKIEDTKSGNWKLATEIIGLFHPLVIHFPVALFIGGALFALFGFRGESPLADAAYYCLWLGALMSIATCASGWFFAIEKNLPDWQQLDLNKSIDVHRWGGILVAVFSLGLALVASSSRRRDPYGSGAMWKIGMLLLAGLTGFVAHHGGEMTHDGLQDKMINKSTQLYENLRGGQSEATESVDAETEPSDDKNDTSGTNDPDGDQANDATETDAGSADKSDGDAPKEETEKSSDEEGSGETSDEGGEEAGDEGDGEAGDG